MLTRYDQSHITNIRNYGGENDPGLNQHNRCCQRKGSWENCRQLKRVFNITAPSLRHEVIGLITFVYLILILPECVLMGCNRTLALFFPLQLWQYYTFLLGAKITNIKTQIKQANAYCVRDCQRMTSTCRTGNDSSSRQRYKPQRFIWKILKRYSKSRRLLSASIKTTPAFLRNPFAICILGSSRKY